MFLRQNANQWVTGGITAIDRGQWWRLNARKHIEGWEGIPEGAGIRVKVGLDRASRWNSTAIVPVWQPPDGSAPRISGVVILESPKDGKQRRTRDVGDILEAMRARWPDMKLVFDRNHGGGDVAVELEEEHGMTVIDFGQGTEFDLASMRLAEYVEEAKLEHEGHEEFSKQVLAAVVKPTSGGKRWRGEAPDDETDIDGFDALAMALYMATEPEEDDVIDLSAYTHFPKS